MRSATRNHVGKDRDYLEFIHSLPCAAAKDYGPWTCYGRIEAHHAGDHGFSQKADDRTAIPLCGRHHLNGPEAIHNMGKRFWEHHGIDRDGLIQKLNAVYDGGETNEESQ